VAGPPGPPGRGRGAFITLEGGEGAGKSTISQRLAETLRQRGHDVLTTCEPEGTPLGRHLWEYFRELASAGEQMTAEAELFLFAAARAEHIQTVIRPALAAGRVVLCDRFADSTAAYQGHGRGIVAATIDAVNRAATGGLVPELTLLLDVPAEEGLRRARALEGQTTHRGETAKRADAIGAESLAFHERVREGFLAIAQAEPGRVKVIDAAQRLDAVEAAALAAVEGLIEGTDK
jgi:dTMP kinase